MEDVIQEAETQLEQGYIEKAEILLKQIIRESTDDKTRGQAALQAGKLLLIQEDYDEALTLFQQAVGDLPDDARTHFYVGVAYRHREQWQAALEAFDRADTLQPNDAAILAQRGGVQFQLSQAAQAKALLNEALRLDPTRTKTQLDRAVVYTSEGDFVAALSCAIQADRLDPGNPAVEETIHTIQELQYRFEDSTHIASIRRSLPRSRKDWERWISTVTSPTELVSSLLEHTHPKSQKDLQALAQRAFDEWNRCPRPELGGISPEQASKRTPKPSDVEDAQTYPWLTVDNMWAENNPVRRDIVAFLTHLDETNYKATASLGNLPLKGVRGVNDLLTQPAQLKHMVGNEVISDHIFAQSGRDSIISCKQGTILIGKSGLRRGRVGRMVKLH